MASNKPELPDGTLASQNDVLEKYESIVWQEVARCGHRDTVLCDRDDLAQYGRMALLDAVKRFNPARGTFEHYARFCVRRGVKEGLRGQADPLSRVLRGWQRRLVEVGETLEVELGRVPTEDELAAGVGVTVAKLDRLQRQLQASRPVELVAWDGAGETDVEADVIKQMVAQSVRDALDILDDRDLAVVSLVYFQGLTLHETARALGMSSSGAHRASVRAVTMLRQALEGLGLR